MNFDDIYGFFRNPPPLYLNQELAVCYILHTLLTRDSYGTESIAKLERDSPNYRLSDTVLYSAVKFLEANDTIVCYWQKAEGRGRPRRMYAIEPTWDLRARELAQFWEDYVRNSASDRAQTVTYDPRELDSKKLINN
jgi:DNA-binding PadR family transcriptional regulator